jgi:hypothetical protein
MNFLTNLKKQEQEKYRTPSWSQAVAELCRFIRRYLREAEAESALRVKPDCFESTRSCSTASPFSFMDKR